MSFEIIEVSSRNCRTKLDSMRAVIGSDGDASCVSCHRADLEADRARGNATGRAHSMPRSVKTLRS